jgi:hypothetical protein
MTYKDLERAIHAVQLPDKHIKLVCIEGREKRK